MQVRQIADGLGFSLVDFCCLCDLESGMSFWGKIYADILLQVS